MLHYNKRLKGRSQELRKNPTDAEKRLWSQIRLKRMDGLQFYRQKIIGDYIADFFCPRAKLVVELDGSQHYSAKMIAADGIRDACLKNQGLTVLRFNDNDVLNNIEGVAEVILEHVRLTA